MAQRNAIVGSIVMGLSGVPTDHLRVVQAVVNNLGRGAAWSKELGVDLPRFLSSWKPSDAEEQISKRLEESFRASGHQGRFWVLRQRGSGEGFQIDVGRIGQESFLTVFIDRMRVRPISWYYNFTDGVHANERFYVNSFEERDVARVIDDINQYLDRL